MRKEVLGILEGEGAREDKGECPRFEGRGERERVVEGEGEEEREEREKEREDEREDEDEWLEEDE